MLQIDNVIGIVTNSGLFDKEWYLQHYPDVQDSGLDPLRHYVWLGARLLRDPGPQFSARKYMENHPEVDPKSTNVLVHYLLNYQDDSFEFVDENHSDINSASENNDSRDEAVRLAQNTIAASDAFDSEWYLSENSDVKQSGLDPIFHYVACGEKEYRWPSPDFDPKFYLQIYSDVRCCGINAFAHYLTHGKYEGRVCKKNNFENRNTARTVLFVGHDAFLAGAQVALLEIISWYFHHTDRYIKILLLEPGELTHKYSMFGDIYSCSKVSDIASRDCLEFLQGQYDFIYLNTVVSGEALDFLPRKLTKNTPIVAHIHEMENVINQHRKGFELVREHADYFVSASPATTQCLKETFDITKEILTVEAFISPLCENQSLVSSYRSSARLELNIPVDALVVVGCGTVYPRKGVDIFVDVACAVTAAFREKPVVFLWLGDGEDKERLKAVAKSRGKEDVILFPGQLPHAARLIAVADIFFLSSREDPFPLVCLEAAQFAIPIVCFDKVTGITSFVKHNAGIIVPEISVSLAAQAIKFLLMDPDTRFALGDNAFKRVHSHNASEKQVLFLDHSIRSYFEISPSVSVVVPNYNHAKFLPERIDSIVMQGIKDIEIILLDDASTDASLDVLQAYAKDDPRIRLYANDHNSGSPFLQWQKGLVLATGAIVWIAESDDVCSENFLETLLPAFLDPSMGLAFCKTDYINFSGEIDSTAQQLYLGRAHPSRYTQSFVSDGIDEVSAAMAFMCTLVNASSALFKRNLLYMACQQAQGMKVCGDWMIYLSILRKGKVHYSISAANYFRRHRESVITRLEGSALYFKERWDIFNFVLNNFRLERRTVQRMIGEWSSEVHRFRDRIEDLSLVAAPVAETAERYLKSCRPSIHIAFYVHGMLFSKGGIERLVANLAVGLIRQGHTVTVFCRLWSGSKPIYALPEKVRLVPVFDEAHVASSVARLRAQLIDRGIDVFVPMLSEWLFEPILEAAQNTGVKIIASEQNDPWYIEELFWSREKRVSTLAKAHYIHMLLDTFKNSLPQALHDRIVVIPNGRFLDETFLKSDGTQTRIISVGRLCKQKNFPVLIEAFALIAARFPDWVVDIFGEGEDETMLQELISDLCLDGRVNLRGVSNEIDREYAKASVFVLPSIFEGFGIVVLEAMSAGLPCIAFEDCNGPNQIITHGVDGFLVGTSDRINQLAEAMERLIVDSSRRKTMRDNALRKVTQFDFEGIISQWDALILRAYADITQPGQ